MPREPRQTSQPADKPVGLVRAQSGMPTIFSRNVLRIGQSERKPKWQVSFATGKHNDSQGKDSGHRGDMPTSRLPPSGSPIRSILRQESRRWSTSDRATDNLRGQLKRRISLSTKLFSGHIGEERDLKSPTNLFGKKNTREKRGNWPEESELRVRMLMSAEMYDRIIRAQKQERDHDSMVNQFKLRTTPTGLQGDSMWINFALSSPQGLGMLAPRKHWSSNGWSHAARVALLLTTLGQERDLLTAGCRNGKNVHIAAQLREQQILNFMKNSCSELVLNIANYYQIAAELAELRSISEAFLQRSNANLDMHSQHEILFPFNSLDTLRIHLEKLQAAEATDGWHTCVKKCVSQNLWATNRGDDRTLDAMSNHRPCIQAFQPESGGVLAWEAFILLLVHCQLIMVPFVLSYPMQRHEVFFELIAELFLLLDIVVQFNIAYFAPCEKVTEISSMESISDSPSIKKTSTLVLDRRLIALHYVSGCTFYLDVLSASPIVVSIITIIDGRLGYKYAPVKLLKYVRIFKMEQMSSVIRKLPRYLSVQQHARQSSRYTSILKLASLLLGIAVTMHILACIWHLITPQHHWELRYNRHSAEFLTYSKLQRRRLYLMSYYESILILMGEQIAMSQVKEYVFAIISTVLFSFLLAIIFGEVAMFTANFNELPFAYSRKMSELHESMSTKSLPCVLQDRVYAFYDLLWREHKTLDGKLKISQFLPELTSNLAIEVRLFWCTDMLLSVPLFKIFPAPVVQRLVIAVDINFFMPDDYIIVAGEIGHEMFFLKNGKVDVFRVDETEVEISDNFGGHMHSTRHQMAADDQRRITGRSFIDSAKSISTGVKNVALQGVSSVKQAIPVRKRGDLQSSASIETEAQSHSQSTSTYHSQPTSTLSSQQNAEFCSRSEPSSRTTSSPTEKNGHLTDSALTSTIDLSAARKPYKLYTNRSSTVSNRAPMAVICARSQKLTGMKGVDRAVHVRRMQREQILATLKPRTFFGEIALVTCCPRTATVKARSFVECATILRHDLEGMLTDHPNMLRRATAMVQSGYYAGFLKRGKSKCKIDSGVIVPTVMQENPGIGPRPHKGSILQPTASISSDVLGHLGQLERSMRKFLEGKSTSLSRRKVHKPFDPSSPPGTRS